MKLHVEVRGQGFPILCLHGHPGSGRALRVFTEALGSQGQTLAPDLRGYGRSRTRTPFEMAAHLDDLEALIASRQLQRYLLLGWSLGGILALELALRQPQQVSGLILIGTAARPRGNHPPWSWRELAYTGIAALLNRLRPGWPWNIETFGRRSLFRYLFGAQTPAAYRYLARDGLTAYLQTSRQASQALQAALATGYNRLPDLSRITCPSLVLAGEQDRHITAAASQETAQQLPNSEWRCYAGAAHLLPWEQPQGLLADIEAWLQAHPAVLGRPEPPAPGSSHSPKTVDR